MPPKLVPRYAFFVAGSGAHRDRLQAFEKALRSAGPFAHNLVAVSSILPPGCTVVPADEGFDMLTTGEITFCVMARQETNSAMEFASAAVGWVRSRASTKFGYISEYQGQAQDVTEAENIAKRLAVELFESRTSAEVENHGHTPPEAIAASIQQTGTDLWVSAVALCVFVL